jgi:hypothetical protein
LKTFAKINTRPLKIILKEPEQKFKITFPILGPILGEPLISIDLSI